MSELISLLELNFPELHSYVTLLHYTEVYLKLREKNCCKPSNSTHVPQNFQIIQTSDRLFKQNKSLEMEQVNYIYMDTCLNLF